MRVRLIIPWGTIFGASKDEPPYEPRICLWPENLEIPEGYEELEIVSGKSNWMQTHVVSCPQCGISYNITALSSAREIRTICPHQKCQQRWSYIINDNACGLGEHPGPDTDSCGCGE